MSCRLLSRRTRWVLALTALGGACLPKAFGVYEPERFGDPSRRWAISVRTGGGYDDNPDTVSTNKQGSFVAGGAIVTQANLPLGQTFLRGRYQYQVSYTENRVGDELDESHSLDALLSHTFSPRLVLDLTDSARRGIEPELVEIQGGQPIELRRRGDYVFNSAGANLSYQLSRRWTASVRGNWELWRYDVDDVAFVNDRDSYLGNVECVYALSPRTYTGVGYQYLINEYDNPGSNDVRNSTAHIGYVTFSHTFNPRLSTAANVGAEFREFGDGTEDTAPSVSASLNYSFARDALATLGVYYSIALTEVGTFRSSDTTTIFARANYRLTQKLRVSVDGLYSLSSFRNPVPGTVNLGDSEEAYRAGVTLSYDFTRLVSGFFNYNYDKADSDVSGRSFDRNRVGVGLNLLY